MRLRHVIYARLGLRPNRLTLSWSPPLPPGIVGLDRERHRAAEEGRLPARLS
jgi:hypothetical protein